MSIARANKNMSQHLSDLEDEATAILNEIEEDSQICEEFLEWEMEQMYQDDYLEFLENEHKENYCSLGDDYYDREIDF